MYINIVGKVLQYHSRARVVVNQEVPVDSAGNPLRFPLEFSFSTIQSSSTINGIQTDPFHGDVEVDLIDHNGIQLIYPRNMDQPSTERAVSIKPE
jgi:hypothetical protein